MECSGLFGKIFGHSFKSFVVSQAPPSVFNFAPLSTEAIKAAMNKKYLICCKSCGMQINKSDEED